MKKKIEFSNHKNPKENPSKYNRFSKAFKTRTNIYQPTGKNETNKNERIKKSIAEVVKL